MNQVLRIAQQNTRKSLIATKELLSYIENSQPDIILIQEPYTKNTDKILGYPLNSKIYHVDNHLTPKTGIYINNRNIYTKILDSFTNSWMTSIQVQLDNQPLVLSTVYINPNSIEPEHLTTLRNLLKTYEKTPVILSGDFNARHTLWNDRIINKHGQLICDLINELELQIHNNSKTTCFTDSGGESIIDLTLTNSIATPFLANWDSRNDLNTIFDHSLIEFDYQLRIRIPTRIPYNTRRYNEKKADWKKFRTLIPTHTIKKITQHIEHTHNTAEIDLCVQQLTNLIQRAAHHSMPTIKRSLYQKRSNWWDKELECLQIVVRNKRNIFAREKDRETKQLYYEDFKHFRNKYVRMIRTKKFRKWKEFLEETQSQDTWGNTYKMLKNKTTPKTYKLPIVEDFPMDQHQDIIKNIVNNIFPSSGHTHHTEHSTNNTLHESLPTNLTKKYIERLTNSTSSKKAPGNDHITYNMLKQINKTTSDLLSKLFYKCLQLGHFPDQWKEGILTIFPKPNKEDLYNPKNYRPISLLPSAGKLFEKIIQREIQNFLTENNKLSPNQHGFMPRKSTITALEDIKRNILDNRSTKMTSVIAIDFTSAFDTANWAIILRNMKTLNIPPHLINIIDSYFHNRSITMIYNNLRYSKTLTQGCPQGSALSPLLWNILINTLLDSFNFPNASIHAYADDVTIVCSGENIDALYNNILTVLTYVNTWSIQNDLIINYHKTNILNFHTETFPSPVRIGSNIVNIVPKIKILGLTLENHHYKKRINFTSHINSTINKTINIKNILFNFCRNTFGINSRKRKNLYVGLIRPILTYGSEIWSDQLNKKQLTNLNRFNMKFLGIP
uniref:Reverse transcriptase domain-containing protein n=1 Tax=Sarcoptes scabiei TaxID=52283 RepID=A0A834VF46_SARSC